MSQRSNMPVLVGAGIVSLAAIGIWLATRDSAPITPTPTAPAGERAAPKAAAHLPGPERPACAFEHGDTLTYKASFRSAMSVDPSLLLPGTQRSSKQTMQHITNKTEARFTARAIGAAPGGETMLALVVHDYSGEVNGQSLPARVIDELDRAFLLRVNTRCKILDIARHETVSPAAMLLAQSIVDTLAYQLPGDMEHEALFTAAQIDTTGSYSADYTYTPSPAHHGVLQRRKVIYAPSEDGAYEVAYKVVRSKTKFELGKTPWFENMEMSEAIVGEIRNLPFSRMKSTASMARVQTHDAAFDGSTIKVREYIWGRVSPEQGYELPQELGLAGMPLEMGAAEFKRILGSGDMKDWRAAREFLRQYLRANPAQAMALVDLMIDAGEFSEWERAVIMHALSETGIPETREALLHAARSAKLDENTRLQAVSAAGDLVNPNRETVESLAELGRRSLEGSETTHDMVGNGANHSVGALLHNHEHGDREVVAAAREYIDEMIAHEDPKRAREGLNAVGNSGDETFIPKVERFIKSEDARTRRAAMRSFRRMDATQTEALDEKIRSSIFYEQDESVTQDYLQSRTTQFAEQESTARMPPEQVWFWVAQFHQAEFSKTKLMYIELLGRAAVHTEDAVKALSSIYWSSTSPAIKTAIGQWITGEQIAAGRARPR